MLFNHQRQFLYLQLTHQKFRIQLGAQNNHESYLRYCKGILEKLKIQNFDKLNEKSVKEHFSKLQKELPNQQQFFNRIIKNYGNKFPFIERGIPFNQSFGEIIYLKNINLADQSVLEGLNSLLEENRNFIVNRRKIINTNQFFIIASTNSASGGYLSEAQNLVLQRQLLKNKVKSVEQQNNRIYNKIFDYIQIKKTYQFLKLNLQIFLLMISFLDWVLKNTSELEKLSLGTQYVLLDPIKLQFSDNIVDEKVLAIFNKARQLLDQEIRCQIGSNSKLVLNQQSNQIISRIFAAFNTKYIPCLIGPLGVDKSALTQEIAKIVKKTILQDMLFRQFQY
ncbi:unnamed protein product [Paramecium sonneborni]|uniref:ATPase dynein-related AAA domain-containing protein n=1 Tax=Paramecium sonneborni TaxID=65129 RepID=A0A8S1RXH0_9CILI|nr:unnamed protein product [Paramecium sonneborni]